MTRQNVAGALIAAACAGVLVLPAPGEAQATSTPAQGAPRTQPAQKPPAPRAPRPAAATGAFDDLVKQADAAREANKIDESIALYEKAVKLKPSYVEGYWYLGTGHYEMDRHRQARDAFRKVLDLQPQNGPAWTLKGLCEFQLQNYDVALTDLLRSREYGISGNKDLVGAARYHMALLMTRMEEYEQALQTLKEFAQEGNDTPSVIEAMGIASLRLPMLPRELPGSRREQVMMAGRATYFGAARLQDAAQKAFEELVQRYPDTPHVHYAFGIFLIGEQPDQAIEQFKQELKISPRHPWAKMQLAYEYIRRSEWETAKPWAEQAVAELPTNFAARRAFGQVLLELGDAEGAIRELEAGARMAPDSPAMRFALARAYRRAGRQADAEREQAEFTRLDRLLRTQRTGAQSVGGIELDSAAPPKSSPSPQ